MKTPGMRVWVDRPFHQRHLSFMVVNVRSDGMHYVGKPLTMEFMEDDSMIVEPTFTLPPEAAQALMDELWRHGLRPTQGQQSEGQLAATQAHLEDLRSIAGGALAALGVDVS